MNVKQGVQGNIIRFPLFIRSLQGRLTVEAGVLIAITACLALQLHLQFTQKINWDEFYYLSLISDFRRGELTEALQTFHVHFFAWLPGLGLHEVDQIVIARVLMWGLEIASLAFLYGTARTFVSRTAALMAVLVYISSGFVLFHGTSFRTDPVAMCLMMYCLYTLAGSQLRAQDLAGLILAAALAALITVKVVFFAPAFISLGLWRAGTASEPARRLAHLSLAAVCTIAIFGVLYSFHLSELPAAELEGSRVMMSSAWQTTLASAGLFPRADFLVAGFFSALPQSLLLIAGGVLASVALVKPIRQIDMNRKQLLVLLGLATPLLSFVFYRNAFPYFFAFVFPPAVILAGFAVEKFRSRPVVLVTLAVMMVTGALAQYIARLAETQDAQTETVSTVHRIFPDPVAYFDRCGMISNFPGRGFLMSGWGIRNYRAAGVPIFEAALARDIVPLLIANSPALEQAIKGTSASGEAVLLPRDIQALQQNYIHHWGSLWVAGKRLEAGTRETTFTIDIPGIYTVESDRVIVLDAQAQPTRSTVYLARGVHHLQSRESVEVTLRWGDNLFRPQQPASSAPLFTGF